MIYLIILTILQLLDILFTYRILKKGGEEKNPIARWLIDKCGFVSLIIFKAVIMIGFAILYYLMPEIRLYIKIGICLLSAVYLIVLVNNIKVMGRM